MIHIALTHCYKLESFYKHNYIQQEHQTISTAPTGR